jgi:hypothetical protein
MKKITLWTTTMVVALAGFTLVTYWATNPTSLMPEQVAEQAASKERIAAWNGELEMHRKCSGAIEKLAQYDFRWTALLRLIAIASSTPGKTWAGAQARAERILAA